MARKIVAIFGPTYRKAKGGKQERKVPKSILDCARDLGAKIAAHNIVLTGGEGPGECSVKDVAIAGAGSGPWIGVIQRGGLETECHNVGNGIVVPTELKHKRNFLEALMCDAAVAFMLPDGPGTRSEVACALALRRPVALVGKGWRALDLAGHGGPKQVADLFEEAREYLDESTVEDATAFTDWIHTCLSREHGKQIIDWLQKTCPKPYRHFEEHQASAIGRGSRTRRSRMLRLGSSRRSQGGGRRWSRTPDGCKWPSGQKRTPDVLFSPGEQAAARGRPPVGVGRFSWHCRLPSTRLDEIATPPVFLITWIDPPKRLSRRRPA